MQLSKAEEDYLKALFQLSKEAGEERAGTNRLADYLEVSPASVHHMLKRLKEKNLVAYEKYGKVELTESGEALAVWLIRKHRLWETFLYRHMNFSWDEVHAVAEQLEHIQSAKLVEELDKFLGFPASDPHGAVIPDALGVYRQEERTTLSTVPPGELCYLKAVADDSVALLRHASQLGLSLHTAIRVRELREFDGTMLVEIAGQSHTISKTFAEHLFVDGVSVS